MKFNVAIGNPPYARGMNIDFVINSFNIVDETGLVCMITPAKWQAAEDTQIIQSENTYGDFKRIVRPYIREVVYYLECSELFKIRNIDGITYYLVDKRKSFENNCKITNKVKHQKYFNNCEIRDITNNQTLNNFGNKMVEILEGTPKFKFDHIDKSKRYQVFTGSQLNGGCGWGYADRENPCGTYDKNGMLYCIGVSVIRDAYDNSNNPEERGAETLTFSSDSMEECDSFISYMNTRLVRFMVLMNVSKLNSVMTNHYFRFVPYVPNGKYDHIFTDAEIYKEFNIPKEYIDVIEAVIKERV